jgi:hypothetical protein
VETTVVVATSLPDETTYHVATFQEFRSWIKCVAPQAGADQYVRVIATEIPFLQDYELSGGDHGD